MAGQSDNIITRAGNTTQSLATLRTAEFPLQYEKAIFEKYGRPWLMTDELRLTGRARSGYVKTRILRAWEEGRLLNDVGIASMTTPDGSGVSTCTIADVDWEASTHAVYIRPGFTLLFAKSDGTKLNYRIDSITPGTGVTVPTFVVKPISSSEKLVSGDETYFAGKRLQVGGYVSTQESGFPMEGLTVPLYERDFYPVILKEKFGIGGGQLALEKYQQVLGNGRTLLSENTFNSQFLLDYAEENAVMFGQVSDLSVTDTTRWTSSTQTATLTGTKGIYKWIESDGGILPWDGNTFGQADMYDMTDYLRSQNVAASVVNIYQGSQLARAVEASALDFVAATSGGTDFCRMVDQSYKGILSEPTVNGDFDKAKDYVLKLGGFRLIDLEGTTFQFKTMKCFSDPKTYKNSNMEYEALVIPMTDVKSYNINGELEMIPNVVIKYLNNNGEDRTRVVGNFNGMTGIVQYPIISQIDAHETCYLTEFLVEVMNANQLMLVRKNA